MVPAGDAQFVVPLTNTDNKLLPMAYTDKITNKIRKANMSLATVDDLFSIPLY